MASPIRWHFGRARLLPSRRLPPLPHVCGSAGASPSRNRRPVPNSGFLPLAVAAALVAVVWLGVLPWLAERPRMAAHLKWLDDRGIDPSAMFYTELETRKSPE